MHQLLANLSVIYFVVFATLFPPRNFWTHFVLTLFFSYTDTRQRWIAITFKNIRLNWIMKASESKRLHGAGHTALISCQSLCEGLLENCSIPMTCQSECLIVQIWTFHAAPCATKRHALQHFFQYMASSPLRALVGCGRGVLDRNKSNEEW